MDFFLYTFWMTWGWVNKETVHIWVNASFIYPRHNHTVIFLIVASPFIQHSHTKQIKKKLLCFRRLKKAGAGYEHMFEEVPITIKNSHLINVLMWDLQEKSTAADKHDLLSLSSRSVTSVGGGMWKRFVICWFILSIRVFLSLSSRFRKGSWPRKCNTRWHALMAQFNPDPSNGASVVSGLKAKAKPSACEQRNLLNAKMWFFFFFLQAFIQICCSVDFMHPFYTNFISLICMRPLHLYPLAPWFFNWCASEFWFYLEWQPRSVQKCHKIHETNMKYANLSDWIWENDILI